MHGSCGVQESALDGSACQQVHSGFGMATGSRRKQGAAEQSLPPPICPHSCQPFLPAPAPACLPPPTSPSPFASISEMSSCVSPALRDTPRMRSARCTCSRERQRAVSTEAGRHVAQEAGVKQAARWTAQGAGQAKQAASGQGGMVRCSCRGMTGKQAGGAGGGRASERAGRRAGRHLLPFLSCGIRPRPIGLAL